MANKLNVFTGLTAHEKDLVKTTLDIVAEALLRGKTALAHSNSAAVFAHSLSGAMGPCEVASCEVCSGEVHESTGERKHR